MTEQMTRVWYKYTNIQIYKTKFKVCQLSDKCFILPAMSQSQYLVVSCIESGKQRYRKCSFEDRKLRIWINIWKEYFFELIWRRRKVSCLYAQNIRNDQLRLLLWIEHISFIISNITSDTNFLLRLNMCTFTGCPKKVPLKLIFLLKPHH